jgi:hypothetical protein
VWVEQDGDRFAGLLVEWARRTELGDWEGRVICWQEVHGRWQLVERWFLAGMLRPADGPARGAADGPGGGGLPSLS